jgi:ankyrin repeat protein
VNASASWTETAIEAAAQTGQVEIVNFLLDHGAEYDISTAAMLGNLSCVKDHLLEDATRIHARGAHGLPLLYFPVIYAHLGHSSILQQGADVNSSSPSGITPLHATVMFNKAECCLAPRPWRNPNTAYDGKTRSWQWL